MFETVVVPLDATPESARAVPTAVAVAKATGAPLELFTVVASDGPVDRGWIDEVRRMIDLPEVEVRVVVDQHPAAAILERQAAHVGTLLCMATNAHTGLAEVILGSVVADVVRGSERSVLLVGPEAQAPKRIEMIQVCLDGSDAARRAAEVAGVWAFELDATLFLVRVAPPMRSGDLGPNTSDLQSTAFDLRRSIGIRPSWDVVHATRTGHVADALVNHAAALPASLIAMTTHAVPGVHERVLGSVAMRVVHGAPCPVLVVPV
jgi:nucleotide-binding universal stress UspA family protein